MSEPRKLGKLAPRIDARTLRMQDYVDLTAEVPVSQDWGSDIGYWGMMRNDEIGDCTCASAAHMIQCWTGNCGDEAEIADDCVVGFYSAVSGYDPAHPDTDRGAYMLDVLRMWRREGFCGHGFHYYVSLVPGRADHVKFALSRFGGVYCGMALPAGIENVSGTWDAPADLTGEWEPGSWGGHAVNIVSYDESGVTIVTWGDLQKVSWGFVKAYMDEAYVLLSSDWVDIDTEGGERSPSGFDMQALKDDLTKVQGSQ